jgi:hypothetical protein
VPRQCWLARISRLPASRRPLALVRRRLSRRRFAASWAALQEPFGPRLGADLRIYAVYARALLTAGSEAKQTEVDGEIEVHVDNRVKPLRVLSGKLSSWCQKRGTGVSSAPRKIFQRLMPACERPLSRTASELLQDAARADHRASTGARAVDALPLR